MSNHVNVSGQIPIVTIVYDPVRDKYGNLTNEVGAGHVAFFNRAAWEHLSRKQKRQIEALLDIPPYNRPKQNPFKRFLAEAHIF
jgi:hypothetical protein